jgi:predicted transposase/invertase (TIGR01784 family)
MRLLPSNDVLFKRVMASPEFLNVPQGLFKDVFGLEVPLSAIHLRSPYSVLEVPVDNVSALRFRQFFRDISYDVEIANITIEMQIRAQSSYLERALGYLTSLYTDSIDFSVPSPARYGTVKAAWSMNLLAHDLFPGDLQALRVFTLKDQANTELDIPVDPADSDGVPPLKLGFFELTKPTIDPVLKAWQQLFLTGQAAGHSPKYIKDAATLANRANLDPKEVKMLDFATRERIERAAELHYATNAGRAEGEIIGEARGEARGEAIGESKARAEIARTLLAAGQNPEFVSQVSGIPISEFQSP